MSTLGGVGEMCTNFTYYADIMLDAFLMYYAQNYVQTYLSLYKPYDTENLNYKITMSSLRYKKNGEVWMQAITTFLQNISTISYISICDQACKNQPCEHKNINFFCLCSIITYELFILTK